jgi:hypothetical protein
MSQDSEGVTALHECVEIPEGDSAIRHKLEIYKMMYESYAGF